MPVYYNEFDPFAVDWLRELIKEGVIADGVVDSRSIKDVQLADLRGFTQHHFFAGIGGWSYALRLAGWPDDKPVWTGSCPCQPFSAAGKRKGTADERHLWPEFQRLIADGEPAIVFGEQVASKDGRLWLTGVRADLEALGYAVGAADLCAAGVGSPHIRQRLYWMADAKSDRWRARGSGGYAGGASRLSDEALRDINRTPDTESEQVRSVGQSWCDGVPIIGDDGKTRRYPSRSEPMAAGISAYMGQLRGYGNAVVPQVAAEFIGACLAP